MDVKRRVKQLEKWLVGDADTIRLYWRPDDDGLYLADDGTTLMVAEVERRGGIALVFTGNVNPADV